MVRDLRDLAVSVSSSGVLTPEKILSRPKAVGERNRHDFPTNYWQPDTLSTQRYDRNHMKSKRLAGTIQLERGRKGRRATEDDIHGPVGDLGHRLAAEWVWERAACSGS